MPAPSPFELPPDGRAFATLARALGSQRTEAAAVAYLDPNWRFLGSRHVAGRGVSVAVPPRLVVRDALAFAATMVVIAHNHPSGDPKPSAADLAVTRALARGLGAIGLRLADHLIVTRGATYSFRSAGLL